MAPAIEHDDHIAQFYGLVGELKGQCYRQYTIKLPENNLHFIEANICMSFHMGNLDETISYIKEAIELKMSLFNECAKIIQLVCLEWPHARNNNDVLVIFKQYLAQHKQEFLTNLYEKGHKRFSAWVPGTKRTKIELESPFLKRWMGEYIEKGILFLENGHAHGDAIMFSRYLNKVKKHFPHICLYIILPFGLLRLYELSYIYSVDHIIDVEDKESIKKLLANTNNDDMYFQTFESLPGFFYNTEECNGTIFSVANSKKLKNVVKETKIALLWKSHKKQQRHAYFATRRDMPLDSLWHLRKFKDQVQFVVIAHGIDKVERDEVCDMLDAIDVVDDIDDFQDVAEYLHECDLLISVDTAYVHLAGAMGKEVWMLDRWDHEWRWPEDPNAPNECYPTLRIFRQPVSRGWNYVMQDVKYALGEWLEEKENKPKIEF